MASRRLIHATGAAIFLLAESNANQRRLLILRAIAKLDQARGAVAT